MVEWYHHYSLKILVAIETRRKSETIKVQVRRVKFPDHGYYLPINLFEFFSCLDHAFIAFPRSLAVHCSSVVCSSSYQFCGLYQFIAVPRSLAVHISSVVFSCSLQFRGPWQFISVPWSLAVHISSRVFSSL